jgi:hypothetical protein
MDPKLTQAEGFIRHGSECGLWLDLLDL